MWQSVHESFSKTLHASLHKAIQHRTVQENSWWHEYRYSIGYTEFCRTYTVTDLLISFMDVGRRGRGTGLADIWSGGNTSEDAPPLSLCLFICICDYDIVMQCYSCLSETCSYYQTRSQSGQTWYSLALGLGPTNFAMGRRYWFTLVQRWSWVGSIHGLGWVGWRLDCVI